jgi:alkylation response protein AidB-like acyl-CoA dehydrogenase
VSRYDDAAFRAQLRAELAATDLARFPVAHADLGYGFGAWSPQFLRWLGERDLIAVSWPAPAGGRGWPARAAYALLQELASAQAPAEALLYTLAVGYCICSVGNRDLQAEFLGPMRSGTVTFAEALSESEAGSDLFSLRTQATATDDGWRLDGQKVWTSNGAHADYALVAARTDPQASRHKGISVFVVGLDQPGVHRSPIIDATGEPSFAEVRFDGVRIPGHRLVGRLNGGIVQVLEALEWDRLYGRCVKAPYLRRELEQVVAALPTWECDLQDPSVRDIVTSLATEIEVCDALFARALESMEASGQSAAREVSIGKLFADELGQRFYHQIAGLIGPDAIAAPADGTAAGALARRIGRGLLTSRGLLLAGGAPDIQRMTIATRGLGLAASVGGAR